MDWNAARLKVKERRVALGWSQRHAAAAAGVSPTTWGSLETHGQPLTEGSAAAISAALGWSPSSLWDLAESGIEPEFAKDQSRPLERARDRIHEAYRAELVSLVNEMPPEYFAAVLGVVAWLDTQAEFKPSTAFEHRDLWELFEPRIEDYIENESSIDALFRDLEWGFTNAAIEFEKALSKLAEAGIPADARQIQEAASRQRPIGGFVVDSLIRDYRDKAQDMWVARVVEASALEDEDLYIGKWRLTGLNGARRFTSAGEAARAETKDGEHGVPIRVADILDPSVQSKIGQHEVRDDPDA